MKVSPLAGAATATRNAKLQLLTQAAAGSVTSTKAGAGSAVTRPATMAPPPRASSFGGVDPRAMFEALVQNFDNDGDGRLSLNEVNALNQGGLLARNFARIDGNADGVLTGDEIAARAPWSSGMLPSDERGGGERGADVRPLIDKLADHLNTERDAALSAEGPAANRRADFASGYSAAMASAQPAPGLASAGFTTVGVKTSAYDPATMMEAMVLARTTAPTPQDDTVRTDAAQQAYTLR